jgi:hypothetical protein
MAELLVLPELAAPPAPPTRFEALRIGIWAGIGAGIGRIIWEATFQKGGLVEWSADKWVGLVLAVAAIVFWEMKIKPPLKARLAGDSPSAPPASSGGTSTLLATLQAILFVVMVATILQLVLGPLRLQPIAFARSVLTLALLCGFITYVWVRCISWPVLGAALAVTVGSFLVSYLVTLADVWFWSGENQFPAVLWNWRFQGALAVGSLAWASWALVGSLAIHLKWGPCSSLGILASALLVDPIWMFGVWWAFGVPAIQRTTLALLLLGTYRSVGWSLGLFICPGADRVLDRASGNRPRASAALFWGMIVAAVLLDAVVIGVASAYRPAG